jgi:glycine cleavage system aminomethyltransferase T
MPPFRHTTLFHIHLRFGACLMEHYGWQIPAYFGGAEEEHQHLLKFAGLSDLSWMTKLDLKGYGVKTLPPAEVVRSWCIGPQHYLLTCDPSKCESVIANLLSFPAPRDLALPPPVYITDETSVYAHFLIAGPGAREILRKLTSLNVNALENLTCGQANLAHVHSLVLRDDFSGTPAFHLLVSREYGESVWEAVMHAGREFQLTPFGLEALQLLRGAA